MIIRIMLIAYVLCITSMILYYAYKLKSVKKYHFICEVNEFVITKKIRRIFHNSDTFFSYGLILKYENIKFKISVSKDTWINVKKGDLYNTLENGKGDNFSLGCPIFIYQYKKKYSALAFRSHVKRFMKINKIKLKDKDALYRAYMIDHYESLRGLIGVFAVALALIMVITIKVLV